MLKIEIDLYQSTDDYAEGAPADLAATKARRRPRASRRADAITLRLSPSRNGNVGRSGSR